MFNFAYEGYGHIDEAAQVTGNGSNPLVIVAVAVFSLIILASIAVLASNRQRLQD